MVCSPKREVYKEWTKGSDIQLIMPLWEWYEMEKLVEQLYRGKVDLKRARENFEWYGGVPRLVVERPSYSPNESKDSQQALDAVATSNVVQVHFVRAAESSPESHCPCSFHFLPFRSSLL